MYNWTVEEQELRKDPHKYAVWRLEQCINYGLNDEKLQHDELMRYWNDLVLDPDRKRFIELLLEA
jgi:hypothetical protein